MDPATQTKIERAEGGIAAIVKLVDSENKRTALRALWALRNAVHEHPANKAEAVACGCVRSAVAAVVDEMVTEVSNMLGIERRAITDDEILDRCMLPLVNEGFRIVGEGIAQRESDLNIVYIYGCGRLCSLARMAHPA